MPKKLDRCFREVKKKIKQGKISKTYKCGRKRCKTSAYAICRAKIKNPKRRYKSSHSMDLAKKHLSKVGMKGSTR